MGGHRKSPMHHQLHLSARALETSNTRGHVIQHCAYAVDLEDEAVKGFRDQPCFDDFGLMISDVPITVDVRKAVNPAISRNQEQHDDFERSADLRSRLHRLSLRR